MTSPRAFDLRVRPRQFERELSAAVSKPLRCKQLIAATPKQLNIYDAATGALLRSPTLPFASARSLSPDWRFLVAGAIELELWDFTKAEKLASVLPKGEGSIEATAVARDGSRFAGAKGEIVFVYDRSGRTLCELTTSNHVHNIALSPDGRSLVSVGFESIARLWEVETCKEVRSFALPAIASAVTFDEGGRFFFTGGIDNIPAMWSFDSDVPVRTFARRLVRPGPIALPEPGRVLTCARRASVFSRSRVGAIGIHCDREA